MKKINLKYFLITIILIFNSNLNAIEKNYFVEGKKLFEENKLDDAKLNFEKAIVFNPKSENSYMYLAKIFKKKDEDAQEELNLDTVILLNPKNEEAIYYLTLLTIKKSNFNKAKDLLSKFNLVCKNICNKGKELKSKLNNLDTH